MSDAAIKEIAGSLAEGLSFLRRTERVTDYFSGYSLAEVIQERITDIGDPDNQKTPIADYDDQPNISVRGWNNGVTKLSEINRLRFDLLGEDGKGGAIGAAKKLVEEGGADGVFFRKLSENQSE